MTIICEKCCSEYYLTKYILLMQELFEKQKIALVAFAETECHAVVDIAFIVDSSGSISRRNWVRMKNFLKEMTKSFQVGPDGAHVAIVAYSTKPVVSLRFSDLQGSKLNTIEVEKVINKLPHQRGFTFIDKALRKSEQEVFTVAAGMRPNVPRVCVI